MKCSNCGDVFRVDDARAEFENHFDGIYYSSDQNGLCGDCAIDRLENWFSTMNRENGINQDEND